jgi:hypothetical protein
MDDQQIDRNELIALVVSMLAENMEDVPPIDHLSIGVLQGIFDDLVSGIIPQIPPPPLEASGQETILLDPDDDWHQYDQNTFVEGAIVLLPNIPQTIHPYAEKIIIPIYNHNIENITNEISLANLPDMDEDDRASLYQAPGVIEFVNEYTGANVVRLSNGSDNIEDYDITSADKTRIMAHKRIKEFISHDDWFDRIINDLKLTENNGNIFKENDILKSVLCDAWLILMTNITNITPQQLEERSNEIAQNLNNQGFISDMRRRGYIGSNYPGTLIAGHIAKINLPFVGKDQQIFRNAKIALTILSGGVDSPSSITAENIRKTYFAYKFVRNNPRLLENINPYRKIIMAYDNPEHTEEILSVYASERVFLENYDLIFKFNNLKGRFVDVPYDFNEDYQGRVRNIILTNAYGRGSTDSIFFMTPFTYITDRITFVTFEFGSKELLQEWNPLVIAFQTFDRIRGETRYTVYPYDLMIKTIKRWNPEVGRPPTFADKLVSSDGKTKVNVKMAYSFLSFAKKLYIKVKKLKDTPLNDKVRLNDLRAVAGLDKKVNKVKWGNGPFKILNSTPQNNLKSPENVSMLYTLSFAGEIGLYLRLLGNVCGGFNMTNFSRERGAINYDILKALANYTDDLIKLSETYSELKDILNLPILLNVGNINAYTNMIGINGIPSNGNLGEDGSVFATIEEILLDINNIVQDESIEDAEKQETFYEYSQWLHATSMLILAPMNMRVGNYNSIQENIKIYFRKNKMPMGSYNFRNFTLYLDNYDLVSYY